jgi:hypothetical protein
MPSWRSPDQAEQLLAVMELPWEVAGSSEGVCARRRAGGMESRHTCHFHRLKFRR